MLDELDRGLGVRLMLAMYPLSDAQAAALLANRAVQRAER